MFDGNKTASIESIQWIQIYWQDIQYINLSNICKSLSLRFVYLYITQERITAIKYADTSEQRRIVILGEKFGRKNNVTETKIMKSITKIKW